MPQELFNVRFYRMLYNPCASNVAPRSAASCTGASSAILCVATKAWTRARVNEMRRVHASVKMWGGIPWAACAYVPLYDSVVDSHAHGLSFPPTLVVVGALMLKRWIVQYGSSKQTV